MRVRSDYETAGESIIFENAEVSLDFGVIRIGEGLTSDG